MNTAKKRRPAGSESTNASNASAVVLPGLAVGFGLCALQGHAEHARAAAGVDYHGRVYNRLWFNDGYHAAHHRAPGADWRGLARDRHAADTVSRLPPALRWAEAVPAIANRASAAALDWLERVTQDMPLVRRHLLRAHAAAFAALLTPDARARIRTVTVIGGGLFPRTTLVLGPLLPEAPRPASPPARASWSSPPCASRSAPQARYATTVFSGSRTPALRAGALIGRGVFVQVVKRHL